MQNLTITDKRIFQRLPVEFPLKYLDLNTNKEGNGRTTDISAGGIGLVTDSDLSKYTPIDIWLTIPDNGEPLYTKAEVVWSKSVAINSYRVGIALKEVDFMGFSRVLTIIREHKNKNLS